MRRHPPVSPPVIIAPGRRHHGAPIGYPDEHVVQAKITIQGIDPPIWRQLLLPLTLNLAGLHEVIQAAFGWTDSHLHQFIIGGLIYGAPEFDEDGQSTHATFEATDVLLRDFDLFHVRNPEFLYEYDFGDGWMHLIEFETTRPIDPDIKYPIGIAGARHGPPEDVGGVTGYADFLEAWSNPEHEEHRALRTWVGRRFSPERFDLDATNKAIRSALRKARGGYRFRLEP